MTCEIFSLNFEVESDISSSINIIDSNVPYNIFFENYLFQNKPCILKNISVNWPCTKLWVKDNKPDFNYLLKNYADCDISVSDCRQQYFNAHKCETFKFSNYIQYWQNYAENGYPQNEPLLYLKDWHLAKLVEQKFYVVPVYFCSDWLNEYFIEKTEDDYQFVYMGPQQTWTPFHADVFTSFSWSVNICGKKRWVLFPPGEESSLRDKFHNLPYDISKVNVHCSYIEVIQNAGEAIFVPSGWHHQVWNLEDTISINHNWVNACNIKNMWHALVNNLEAVKREIMDCNDMENWLGHCQLMLKLSFGLDFEMFYDFLQHIASKRINLLGGNVNCKLFDSWLLGKNHAKFDLLKIKDILEMFIAHTDFDMIFIPKEDVPTPQILLSNIIDVLQ